MSICKKCGKWYASDTLAEYCTKCKSKTKHAGEIKVSKNKVYWDEEHVAICDACDTDFMYDADKTYYCPHCGVIITGTYKDDNWNV